MTHPLTDSERQEALDAFCKEENLAMSIVLRSFGDPVNHSTLHSQISLWLAAWQASRAAVPEGCVPVKAARLKACRDNFVLENYEEAYNQLYWSLNPKDSYHPWKEVEQMAKEHPINDADIAAPPAPKEEG